MIPEPVLAFTCLLILTIYYFFFKLIYVKKKNQKWSRPPCHPLCWETRRATNSLVLTLPVACFGERILRMPKWTPPISPAHFRERNAVSLQWSLNATRPDWRGLWAESLKGAAPPPMAAGGDLVIPTSSVFSPSSSVYLCVWWVRIRMWVHGTCTCVWRPKVDVRSLSHFSLRQAPSIKPRAHR